MGWRNVGHKLSDMALLARVSESHRLAYEAELRSLRDWLIEQVGEPIKPIPDKPAGRISQGSGA